jgi:flagellar hook-associated protein 2
MPALTSLGIGTGTDLNSIVSQLVALERRPLQDMQRSATKLQTQVSSMGKLQSLFSTLQDTSNALTSNSLWAQSVATSSNETAVATVGGGSAAAGNYSVSVQALAGSQTLVSGGTFASATEPVGSGSLTLQLGSWDTPPSLFSPKGESFPLVLPVTVADTVTSLRDKINAAGAGVTASIVSDASGVRLALRSSSTGASNGFRITAADADGNNTDAAGLSSFAYDPPSGANGLQLKQSASDARASVNGIDVVSASNELSGTIEGLTLRLRQVTTAPVDVAVSSDREGLTKSITAFATAYSALASYITEQTKFDAGSRVSGALQGDSSVTSLQGRMRAVLNAASGASSQFSRMSDIGLQLQRDGSLTVNTSKLNNALTQLPELKKAFANSDPLASANDGFARRYQQLASQVLAADGSVTTRTEGLRKAISKNTENQAKLNERVDRFQERLVAQYSAMDVRQSKLTALSSYVTQQLAAMNRTNNS